MYDVKKLQEEAIKAIKENDLKFIEEVVDCLPCSKRTFYEYKLHEVDAIQDLLWSNKVRLKTRLRKKWEDSDNFNAEKHLYLLVGTDEEREILSSRPVQTTNIIMPEKELTDEELNAQLDAFKDAQESK